MFWKRRTARSADAPAQAPAEHRSAPDLPSLGDELERALDALAEVVRAAGRHAFELPDRPCRETGAVSEQWAQHLLVRARRPIDPEDEAAAPSRRDFDGAVRFTSDLLRAEESYHEKTLEDLRRAIWDFVDGLHRALVGDAESDTRVKGELLRLRATAERGTPEDLRREAATVAENIGVALEERRERQRSQAAELAARVSALGSQLEEAKREGAVDALTQVWNRRAFDQHVEKAIAVYALVSQPICLVLVDVDHFKQVNDGYGHAKGDEVLRGVAGSLVKTFLRRDDFIARYGGEEFAVVLRDTRAVDAMSVTDRLLRRVRAQTFDFDGEARPVTISAGVAQFEPGESVKEWIDRADRALYAAKNGGRDRACLAAG